MKIRYPLPGDIYRSIIYPDQTCRVLQVLNAIVTFKWLGQYEHVEEQTAAVVQFTSDFRHQGEPAADSADDADASDRGSIG